MHARALTPGSHACTAQVIDAMLSHPQLGRLLAHPSVSYGSSNLYMRGALDAVTRPNLERPMAELLELDPAAVAADPPLLLLTVNDKKLSAPLRVRLKLGGEAPMES